MCQEKGKKKQHVSRNLCFFLQFLQRTKNGCCFNLATIWFFRTCQSQKWNLEAILPTFFLRKRRIFPFFATELGRCTVVLVVVVKKCVYCNSTHIFFICYKLSSLTEKIGKPEKWKFGRIDSSNVLKLYLLNIKANPK